MWLFARILLREKREEDRRKHVKQRGERERERKGEKRDERGWRERERDSESVRVGGGGFDLKNQGLGFAPDRKKPCYRKSNSS